MRPRERPVPRIVGGFDQMRDERDQITLLLRGLAARLEELDRTLADLAWHSQHTLHRPTASATSEFLWKGTTLRMERERLSARLGVLARQLGDLDDRLATDPGSGSARCRRRVCAPSAATRAWDRGCALSADRTWRAEPTPRGSSANPD